MKKLLARLGIRVPTESNVSEPISEKEKQNSSQSTQQRLIHMERFYEHDRFFALIDRVKAKPVDWILLSLLMVAGDFVTGSVIQFPLLYIIPVSLAAWSRKKVHAYLLAFLLPATRIPMAVAWNLPLTPIEHGVNFVIRALILMGLVHLLSIVQSLRILRGILHTCSYCRRIESVEGKWMTAEEFIADHSEAMLSHGICPDCATKHWGAYQKD
jgi:hypothetical protein